MGMDSIEQEFFSDSFGNGQRGGQPRRLDPEEVDQPGDAMGFRPLNEKVGGRVVGADDLRSDSGVGRCARAPSGKPGQ